MASNTIVNLLCHPNAIRNHNPTVLFLYKTTTSLCRIQRFSSSSSSSASVRSSHSVSATLHPMEALIFDCDGVILESEDLHRQAYNLAFAHFNVCCPPFSEPLNWDTEFYDVLQNQIGGGKPKMRWYLSVLYIYLCVGKCCNWKLKWLIRYFKENGWPSSTIFITPPETDIDRAMLIDTLQVFNQPNIIILELKFSICL